MGCRHFWGTCTTHIHSTHTHTGTQTLAHRHETCAPALAHTRAEQTPFTNHTCKTHTHDMQNSAGRSTLGMATPARAAKEVHQCCVSAGVKGSMACGTNVGGGDQEGPCGEVRRLMWWRNEWFCSPHPKPPPEQPFWDREVPQTSKVWNKWQERSAGRILTGNCNAKLG